MSGMRLYVSGPMRGKPLFNFPAFDGACDWLRELGHTPIGPQEMDRLFGFNEHKDVPDASRLRTFLRRDLMAILDSVDGVVVLEGWQCSKGAVAEVALAQAIGLPVFSVTMRELNISLVPWEHEDEFTWEDL